MATLLDAIDPSLATWLEQQPMFFVASAPLDAEGHVNVSPKGMAGSFRVVGEHEIAYHDVTGSGAETIAHIRENGRITVMFCAFDGRPRIVRLYGTGSVHLPSSADYAALVPNFPPFDGTRSIITIAVDRITTSCGYGVPEMEFVADRRILLLDAAKKGPEKLEAYRRENNAVSIDGLPALGE